MTLQKAPYAALAESWRRAEAQGWESIWIADHTTAQYPKLIAYEAWTLMGALACETTRARIGTMVTPITFRHPALLAMSVTTVDHVSGGRVELGLGTGGAALDAKAVGLELWEPGERVRRLEEQLQILDALLRGETVERSGGRYPTASVVEQPIQRPRPPFVVAAHGPRSMALAARYGDAWNTLGGQPTRGTGREAVPLDEAVAVSRQQLIELDEACASVGRDPASLRRTVVAYRVQVFESVGFFEEYAGRYLELGFDELIAYWPFDWQRGIDDPRLHHVMEVVAADVLPRLRRAAAAR